MERQVRRTATWALMALAMVASWLAAPETSHAQEVISRTAAGATPAAIQRTLDLLRQKLGGNNNGTGGTFLTGRREITWDEVPDAEAAPAEFLPNYFNTEIPRGVIFKTPTAGGAMQVSMDDNVG